MTKRLIVSLAAALLATGAMAGVQNSHRFLSDWGDGKYNTCVEHEFTDSKELCLGESYNCASGFGCEYGNTNCTTHGMVASNSDGRSTALIMMVAKTINQHGAFFCPMQVESRVNNAGDGNAWTEYRDSNVADCVWLCLDGWTGDTCSVAADMSDGACDSSVLFQTNFASLTRVASGPNVEHYVGMFYANAMEHCGANRYQEHDMILAIVGWLPSGHGAWAQQLNVRAQRRGWEPQYAWPAISKASDVKKLVCKNGYQPNDTATDCIPINYEVCPESEDDKLRRMCEGWDADSFDNKIHVFQFDDEMDCYQFRCKGQNKGFDGSGNYVCVDLSTRTDISDGIDPETGLIVTCEIGQIFDTSTGTCHDTVSYSKSDLRYGKGETKDSVKRILDQCWTVMSVDDYKDCVFGIEPQVTGQRKMILYER